MSKPDDAAASADFKKQDQAQKSGKTEVAGVLPIHPPPGSGNDEPQEHPWGNRPGGKDDEFEKDGKNRKEPWQPGPTRNA